VVHLYLDNALMDFMAIQKTGRRRKNFGLGLVGKTKMNNLFSVIGTIVVNSISQFVKIFL